MNYFLPFLNAGLLFVIIDMSNPLNKEYNNILDYLDAEFVSGKLDLLIKLLMCGFCLAFWISLIEGIILWDFWYISYSWIVTAITYGMLKKLYD